MLTQHRAESNSTRQQQIWHRDRWSYILQRSCLPSRITEENTHSSVSPGILSLSRWAFMAELCSFALLWSWCAFTLPAWLPPPCTDKEPNPATTARWDGLDFFPPTKREGVKKKKKGGYSSCFGLSMFHLEAVKRDPLLPAEGMEAGQYPFSPPLIHAPCSFTNACIFVSPHHNSPTSWWLAI